jgi:hypothetical protein
MPDQSSGHPPIPGDDIAQRLDNSLILDAVFYL